MQVTVIKECGYTEAAIGLSLSWDKDPNDMPTVMRKLYNKDGGHNKFLEQISVWIDITAPRYWWSQFDTYRIGVSKQSGSTMHTLMKRLLTQGDFEDSINDGTLIRLNSLILSKEFHRVKNELPEGFLQRRIVKTDYKTLRNIIWQRKSHRLEQWQKFCDEVYNQVGHPEFLSDLMGIEL